MSQKKLDNFVATIWERPTSDLIALYINGYLRDGKHLRNFVLAPGREFAEPTIEDARFTDAALEAVVTEIDRRLPVVRCVGCKGKPHRDPMPAFGGFCHGDTK